MMDRIKWFLGWCTRRAEDVVVFILGSMFVCFLLQIVFRYLLNLPLGWVEEYVTGAWLWGILFGYAFVLRINEAIRLDLVYNLVGSGPRRVMNIVSGLVGAGVLIYSLPATWSYIDFMFIEKTAYLRIPMGLVFIVYVPFVLSIIVRNLFIAWNALRYGRQYF
ncbi:TRAP transporter small permease [Rhizobium alvei]|uniref:TRAP transporter small permease protein n=1 Tax=Rhizobium alvei TaxID=1132659 RepID=A0ABT8YT44_9HYPH|nr:TRAP transporter small permease subunit [Rhizobium alvei]MDO6966695.1 TRAP transporter small permease subunit [Rhizobium alvei]